MNKTTLLAFAIAAAACVEAAGQTVSRSYSYFSIGGSTLEEIDRELTNRGPKLNNTGRRHPGATRMRFSSKLTFASTERWCAVEKAAVTVNADIILPRWNQRKRADGDTRLIWDTLSSDIKRHEEFHVQIAKRHAREMEEALEGMGRMGDCNAVRARAAEVSKRILEKHDREQASFDRIESKNFEKRLLRLLTYRLEQIESGRLAR